MSDIMVEVVGRLQELSRRIDDAFANISGVRSSSREELTAVRTYYVRTDGSNSNNGMANTASGAFLTIQAAINAAAALDNAGFAITIQIEDGTYTENLTLISGVGAGTITLQGNSATPTNVVITCSSGVAISTLNVKTTYALKDFRLTGTGTATIAMQFQGGGYFSLSGVDFGTGFSTYHIFSLDYAEVEATGNYTVSGGCVSHWSASVGIIRCQNKTITITGTPAFSSAWAISSRGGSNIIANGNTFTGSATGRHYNANENAVIDVGANPSETNFPGNTLGTLGAGAIYGVPAQIITRNSAQFDKNNVTLANITGMSYAALAGRTYSFRAVLYTTSNIASGVKAAIAGTATATAIIYEGMVYQAGVFVAPGASRAVALGTAVANVTAVTVATIIVEGTITVNTAGTITVQFADNAGVFTSSVLVGSNFVVIDITP